MEDSPAAVVITNQELDQLRKVARDGGVGETLRELEDTLEETTDMVDELRVNLCKTQAAHEDLKQEAATEKALQAGLKQEVAAGKGRVEELKQQLADADAAQALLRKEAAADTRLEDKDDEVSELRIKLLEAETEVTELKIKHSASTEQLERDAAQLRRELKAAAATHAEMQRELAAVRATLEVSSDRRATLEAIPLAPPPLAPPPPQRHTRCSTTKRLFSVLPAPDSPLTMMATRGWWCRDMHASSATAYACGSRASRCPTKERILAWPTSAGTVSHGLTATSCDGPTQVQKRPSRTRRRVLASKVASLRCTSPQQSSGSAAVGSLRRWRRSGAR